MSDGLADGLTERVIAVVAKSRKVPREQLSLDTTFEDLQMDSLDGIDLVFELENEFNIAIPDEDARVIRDVRQAVESLRRLLPSGITDNGASATS